MHLSAHALTSSTRLSLLCDSSESIFEDLSSTRSVDPGDRRSNLDINRAPSLVGLEKPIPEHTRCFALLIFVCASARAAEV